MKNKLMVVIGLFLTLLIESSFAGTYGAGNGLIKTVAVGAGGTGHAPMDMVYFQVETFSMGACANGTVDPYFVIDTSKPGGKDMYSLVLASKLSGQTLFIAGKGTCNTLAGNEDVSYIYIK